MKNSPLIAAACAVLTLGCFPGTASSAETFGPCAQPGAKTSSTPAVATGKRAKATARRAGPRNTVVMPSGEPDDSALTASTVEAKN